MKDLKKKEQIIAKLATLPNDWVTYILNAAAEPAVPAVAAMAVLQYICSALISNQWNKFRLIYDQPLTARID